MKSEDEGRASVTYDYNQTPEEVDEIITYHNLKEYKDTLAPHELIYDTIQSQNKSGGLTGGFTSVLTSTNL